MKRIIALILSLMMVLTCAAAFAEETAGAEKAQLGKLTVNHAFDIKYGDLPDGYTMKQVINNESEITALIEGEGKPLMILSISFDDSSFAEVERLNDVTEEQMNYLKSTWTEELQNVTFDTAETAYGTQLLIATVSFDDGSMISSIFTIYKGYNIEIAILPIDQNPVTQENIDAVVKFLSDMDFVPVAE